MDGHQLDGVPRRVIFQAEDAAGLFEVFEILQKFRQTSGFAFGLPILYELAELIDIFAILRSGALRNLEPFREVGQSFTSGATTHRFALFGEEFEKLFAGSGRRIKGQLALGGLQDIVERRTAFLCGALGEADQVWSREMPSGNRKHAGTGNVVVRKTRLSEDTRARRGREDDRESKVC